MKIISFLILVLSIFIGMNSSAYSQGEGKTFVVEDGVKMTAEVIKIDKKSRKVTLKGKDGKEKTVKIPKEIKGIDKIDVGDMLNIEIIYSLAIELAKPGELEGEKIFTAVRYSKKGEKPKSMAAETVEVVAKIQSLDLATRRVTLVGDKGHTITLIADSSVKNFETLKIGEEVHARYVEEFVIGFYEHNGE